MPSLALLSQVKCGYSVMCACIMFITQRPSSSRFWFLRLFNTASSTSEFM
jgi:hypothetical protein